ncbi:hypothetical protein AC482_05130 [miscellaneous Crenarchaeota group-15 archaeon DG-45]|uniref:Uncharacterized protein n=1 Tax=miscellaneous Crenarchaeota group-15 archaeon DG-45 TaxID=1685127 RepID=A0A0M0BNK8_9ARCH|nr:MAG: hypothetical protein AC482_05130 [miscellaneous Crenarchaeota group-15 archaeon DG-45]
MEKFRMRLKAFSIRQHGERSQFDIYVSTMPASQLIERSAIDRWIPVRRQIKQLQLVLSYAILCSFLKPSLWMKRYSTHPQTTRNGGWKAVEA